MALCPSCAPARAARDYVLSESFWSSAGTVLVPLVAVLVLVGVLAWQSRRWPLATAGMALGAGLGGFADGILLHQVLQWHQMVSSRVPATELVGAKVNMIWDGAFHAVVWVSTLVGIALLFRAARATVRWSGRVLAGAMLAGWGVFNLAEGVIDHLVLGLHHVRPGPHQLAWDLGFVVIGGVGLIAAGYLLAHMRSARDDERLRAVPGPTG